jgi:trigger factor
MKSNIKSISDTELEVYIELGVEELAIAEAAALKHLSHNVKVPGFRKGKAPIDMAKKSVDPNALAEHALDSAINEAIKDVFTDNQIQAIDRPTIELKKYVPGSVVELTARVSVLPKIKLGDYKKLKTTKTKISVDQKEVDEIVEKMRGALAEKSEVKRSAELGDEVVIDFVGKKDGVAFEGGTSSDYRLKLGSKQFIPGFEEGVVGHKAGDRFDLDLSFPEDYGAENLKGAKVVFEVTLKSVSEAVVPKIDDTFAAKCGPFKTVKEMLDDIKRELTAQKQREADEKLKDELVTQLVEKSQVSAPKVLVDDQIGAIERDFMNNLSYQGKSLEDYLKEMKFKDREDWIKKELETVADKRVKVALVLNELSRTEKLAVDKSELDERLNTYKTQYASNESMLKRFDEPGVIRDIEYRLITEKAVNLLLELNKK